MSQPSDATKHEQKTRPHLMERRQFLTLSATAMVGLAAGSIPMNALADTKKAGASLLLVGYSDSMANNGKSSAGTSVRSATSITSLSLGSSAAQVRIQGVWRSADAKNAPLLATILAYIQTNSGAVPLVLWTLDSMAGSAPARLSPAPIAITNGGVELAILTRNNAPAHNYNGPDADLPHVVAGNVNEVLPTHDALVAAGQIVALGASSANKLAWGTYFIAFPDGKAKVPSDWTGIRIGDLSNPATVDLRGAGPLSRASALSSSAPEFSYAMLTLEQQPVESVKSHTN